MELCEACKEKDFHLLKSIEDPIERLSVEKSHPYWLVKRWIEQFGYDETMKMCELNLTAPIMTAGLIQQKRM